MKRYARLAVLGLAFAAILGMGIALGIGLLVAWMNLIGRAEQHFFIQ